MELSWPFLISLSVMGLFIFISFLAIIIYKFKLYNLFIVSANPNEWILIIGSDGKLKKANIGITSLLSPFDKYVKFPSQIHKLTFATDQVDKNMQGIQIGGMLVWSIFRTEDGPYRAYKYLGEDIKSANPYTAQDNLKSMCESIVRHCIANSTIQDLLVNRNFIRDTIRKDMLEVVKGWGIWLETVEITEVKIMSQTLFKNMQTKFREENNELAQKLTMDSNQNIYEHELKVNLFKTQANEEKVTKEEFHKTENKLKRQQNDEKVNEQIDKIIQTSFKRQKDTEAYKEEVSQEFFRKQNQLGVETQLQKFKDEIKKIEAEKEVVNQSHFIGKIRTNNNLELKQLEKDQANKQLIDEMEMKTKYFDEKNMKHKILSSYSEVYQKLPVKEIKMVNMFGQQDSVGNGMMQFIGAYQELTKQFKSE